MADSVQYFNEALPAKFSSDSDFADAVQNVFQFEIEGAGTWHIVPGQGVVSGEHDDPECVVASDKDTFDEILDNPESAMGKFMEGKISASDLGLAMQLQQFLG